MRPTLAEACELRNTVMNVVGQFAKLRFPFLRCLGDATEQVDTPEEQIEIRRLDL